MDTLTVAVFLLVYLGMLLGGLPFLQLDRTGVALIGAITLVASQALSTEDAFRALHTPTLILLFSFMVISAQLRLGGFYTWIAQRIGSTPSRPASLLGGLILVAASMSAVFSNDVICLAMAPVIIESCLARRINPLPFLIGLACAANIGSAATLIGNPQNMLIGQTLHLAFGRYLLQACIPVMLSLLAAWGVIVLLQQRRGWALSDTSWVTAHIPLSPPPFDLWQTSKGLTVAATLFAAFLFAPWPHDLMALAGAGLLLSSRRLHSRQMLGLVDWPQLILFMGLFVVNHAFQQTGLPAQAVAYLAAHDFDLGAQGPLFLAGFALSNLVSNVPATMLLLPAVAGEQGGIVLALSSTLAGNLLLVGSIANLIVANEAAHRGIRLDWREHARLGVPVTLLSIVITGSYLGMTQ